MAESVVSARARYTRQSRLVEVGEEGQLRLLASDRATASSGFSSKIEALYLAGAGVRVLDGAGEPSGSEAAREGRDGFVETALLGLALRHDEALEVSTGALHALAAVAGILQGQADPGGTS